MSQPQDNPSPPPPDPQDSKSSEKKKPETKPEPLPPELQEKIEFDRYTGAVRYREPPGMQFLAYLHDLMAPIHATNVKGTLDSFQYRKYVSRTAYTQAMALSLKYRLAIEQTKSAGELAEYNEEMRKAALLIAEGTRMYEAWQNERRGNIVFVEPRQKVKT